MPADSIQTNPLQGAQRMIPHETQCSRGYWPKVESYFGFDILMSMMHKLRLMHQDIKPENIMFSPSLKRHHRFQR